MANRQKEGINTDSQEKRKDTRMFPLASLQANCRKLFGVLTCTFVGATCGMSGSYTVEDMRGHIETWKRKGVR